jgi:predicted aminopeptidase
MVQIRRVFPVLRAVLLLGIAVVLIRSLTGCYYLQAAAGQLEISSKRRAIEQLIEDPGTEPALRSRLEYVQSARDFAVRELALPDNGSYRSYTALDRPFVVWNVFATDEFSVQPRRWCFPVAGCVVYRGYFDVGAAERYAQRIRLEGGDAMVAGAAAYSTLGHFDDPVLSTMMRWSDAQLAATLFHELAHQVVYVAGDAPFNESFATVVEHVGVERWLTSRGEASLLAQWRETERRAGEFQALLLDTRRRLAEAYAEGGPTDQLRAAKARIFGRMKYEYSLLRERWGNYPGYDAWFDRPLNNAHLVPVATYQDCVPGFERLLAAAGGDLAVFYADVERVASMPAQQRTASVCATAEAVTTTDAGSRVRSP